MPMYKVTIPFEHQQNGWSETYYRLETTYESCFAKALKLIRLRMALCGNDVKVPAVRISNEEVAGDGRPYRLDIRTGFKSDENEDEEVITPAYSGDPDMSWTSLPVGLLTELGRTGRVFLRGLPDNAFVRGNSFRLLTGWDKAYGAWKKELLTGWCFKGVTIPIDADWKIPTEVLALGSTNVSMTVANLNVFQGDQVQVSAFRTNNGTFSGRFRVSFYEVDKLVLDKTHGIFFTWQGRGKIRKLTHQYFQISDTSRGRPSERKPGRPFDSPRGRRQKGFRPQ